jgi:hypothetical protein
MRPRARARPAPRRRPGSGSGRHGHWHVSHGHGVDTVTASARAGYRASVCSESRAAAARRPGASESRSHRDEPDSAWQPGRPQESAAPAVTLAAGWIPESQTLSPTGTGAAGAAAAAVASVRWA